eukprot:TRINITY_DN11305_c0_g1_i6.p1 TRINITY_DN11305_c0_g1~~TRINITY_DN11305_c0_g1_i6.p1  ORF type:complete len:388 (+),score=59.74 TRINITY_DN11305_c0_g1_i6:56-1219(+)
MAFRIGFPSSHLLLHRLHPHLRRGDRVALFKLAAASRRSLALLWPRETSRAFCSHLGDIAKKLRNEQVGKWSKDRVQQWVVAVLEANGHDAMDVEEVRVVFMAQRLIGKNLVTLTVQKMMADGVPRGPAELLFEDIQERLPKQLVAAAKVQAGRQLHDVTSMRGRPNQGDWILAEPMLCETANFEALQVVAKRLDTDIIAAVKDPAGTNRRRSLLLAAQNGMGTGKSHMVDSLSDILPLLRGGITLKVTYNFDQDLHNDVSTYHERSHIQCLLTRIALATRMERCQDVELDITMNGWVQDHENSLAAFLHEEYHDRPILIAVDELSSLFEAAKAQFGESAYAAMREVLSVLRRLCERVNDLREWDTSRLCLAFVTALPSLAITTLSR